MPGEEMTHPGSRGGLWCTRPMRDTRSGPGKRHHAKAAGVLRPGGPLAAFWHVFEPPQEVADAFGGAFRRLVPESPLSAHHGTAHDGGDHGHTDLTRDTPAPHMVLRIAELSTYCVPHDDHHRFPTAPHAGPQAQRR